MRHNYSLGRERERDIHINCVALNNNMGDGSTALAVGSPSYEGDIQARCEEDCTCDVFTAESLSLKSGLQAA